MLEEVDFLYAMAWKNHADSREQEKQGFNKGFVETMQYSRGCAEAYCANLLASDLLGLGVLPVVLDSPRHWEGLT